VPARLVSTLIAIAAYAGEDGRGAYPSGATVAILTRKSESQAKRDMAELEKLGLLLAGDERIVKDIRADRRPNVYDLAMPRGASERPPSQDPRGASGHRTGRISEQNGVRPDAPEEFLKNSGKARGRASAEGARASAPETSPRRIWPCPQCGEGFTPEDLADAEDRRSAEEGDLWHAECLEAFRASEEYEPP
jgi:hypothetical protein